MVVNKSVFVGYNCTRYTVEIIIKFEGNIESYSCSLRVEDCIVFTICYCFTKKIVLLVLCFACLKNDNMYCCLCFAMLCYVGQGLGLPRDPALTSKALSPCEGPLLTVFVGRPRATIELVHKST